MSGQASAGPETDHKPLESIMMNLLNSALTILQPILLKLQRYNLVVTYKKGTTILLADTLIVHIYLV